MTYANASLNRASTALVIVDVQERLAAAMPSEALERCVRGIGILVEAARLMSFPVIVTEQYPRGLGPTVAPLREKLAALSPPSVPIEKLAFAATGEPAFVEALEAIAARRPLQSIVVTGMEAHICVYQTVRGLARPGLSVHVPWDATCSRSAGDAQVAHSLWARDGAVVTSTETVLFDLLGRAGTDEFRALSKLLR